MGMKKVTVGIALLLILFGYAFLGKKDQAETPAIQSNISQIIPTGNPTTTTETQQTSGNYKDGSYTGSVADAFYGPLQVKVTIQNGKITDVEFLQYPNDRGESVEINTQAMPLLKQEAITAQSANVDIITGATQTSQAFLQTLGSALAQAR